MREKREKIIVLMDLFLRDFAWGPGFDFVDLCLLFGNFICGLIIVYQDWKTQMFSRRMTFCLCLLAAGWCWKQRFFPFPLCPIAVGLFLIWGLERFTKKRLIGEGDIFLFLQASCYFFLNELSAFLMICGSGGIATFFLKSDRKNRKRTFPFASSIILAQWTAFVLSVRLFG